VSKDSAAKKARRKKRLAARNDGWLPAEVHADVRAVARIASEIIPRGWEFDREYSTEEFVTWFYPPSGLDDEQALEDESVEPVTRIWLTDPLEPHVLLVGTAEGDGVEGGGVEYQFAAEELFSRLDAIEAYRLGDPAPSF
jgi:hypothetical protein